jgi:hypothetical protein
MQALQLNAARIKVASQMKDADALQGKIDVMSKEVPPSRHAMSWAFCSCAVLIPSCVSCEQAEKTTAALSSRQQLDKLKVTPIVIFYNQFVLMNVKRAMASMQAELRSLDAHLGLRAVLVLSEGSRTAAGVRGGDADEETSLL